MPKKSNNWNMYMGKSFLSKIVHFDGFLSEFKMNREKKSSIWEWDQNKQNRTKWTG